MKILHEVINVFIYFHFILIAPVQMYYIYGDSPKMGYVSMSSGVKAYPNVGQIDVKRKFIIPPVNPRFQKRNKEHAVDNRFKVMKSAPNQIGTTSIDNKHLKESKRFTEAPHPNVTAKGYMKPLEDNKISNQFKSRLINSQLKQHNQINKYDTNFVKGNVNRKTQLRSGSQKVKMNNNRQVASLSVKRRADDVYRRIPITAILDKTFHKTSMHNKNNAQVMSKVLDNMAQKIADRVRFKTNEYKKRDTESSYEIKGNGMSDSLKKYIGNDKNVVKDSKIETSRVGDQEDGVDENGPYALFYRTNPESIENHNDFIIMDPQNHKETESNFAQDRDVKKLPGTIILREKIKNFSSFSNH